jgi:hypothetical protein
MPNLNPRVAWLVLALLLSAGCGRCGGSPSPIDADTADLPTGPAAVTVALARVLPASTEAVVFVRSWRAALERYADARPYLQNVTGDLGFVETDLRNTLALDLRRPDSFDEIGIASDGGMAAAWVVDTPAFAFLLADVESFTEQLAATMAAPPIGLDEAPEQKAVGACSMTLFRRSGQQRVEAAFAIIGAVGVLFPNPPTDGPNRAVAAMCDASTGDNLSNSDALATSIEDAGDRAYLLHLETIGTAPVLDALSAATGLAGSDLAGTAARYGHGNIAFDLDATGLVGRWRQHPTAAMLASMRELTVSGDPPGFARLVNDETFILLRLTLEPARAFALARSARDEAYAAPIDEQLAAFDAAFGAPFADAVLPALGAHWTALATRARLFTLNRAISSGKAGDWFGGLGIVLAVEVNDRAVIDQAMRAIATTLEGRADLFESDGTLVLEFTDADADLGNLVLTDTMLLLVPARQRRDVVGQLTTGEGVSTTVLDTPLAIELVEAAGINGLYINVASVVSGPLGQVALARLPEEVQRALAQFDRAVIAGAVEDNAWSMDVQLRFTDLTPP